MKEGMLENAGKIMAQHLEESQNLQLKNVLAVVELF